MAANTVVTPFPLGAYTGTPDNSNAAYEASYEANYASFVSTLGAAPQFLDLYVDYTHPISQWVNSAGFAASSDAQSAVAKAQTPVIGLPMASTAAGSATPDQQFQAFASGHYDSVLQGIVKAYADQGFKSLVFRPGWEMNLQGPTYAGDSAQSQADWVRAFQHIYTVLHQTAAASGVAIQVMWNPGATNYSNAEATTNLYPGDAYVDTIGADIYADAYPYTDSNGATPTYHDWTTGKEDTSVAQLLADPANRVHYWNNPAANIDSMDSSVGHSQSFASIVQFAEAHGKSLAIPETGAGNSNSGADVTDDAAFPQWLAQQLSAAQAAGEKIDFVNLWDSNGGGNYEFSNASDGKPQEAAAWAKYFGAQAAATTPPPTPPVTPPVTPPPVTPPTPPIVPVQPVVPAALTLGSGHDAIVLALSEDAYQGNAQYTLAVDGKQVGGLQTETASHAAGQAQLVTLQGDWGDGTHVVSVDFTNDAYAGTAATDRNLYAASASYNGAASAGSLTLLSAGTQSLTLGTPAPAATSIGSGRDTIALQMNEDAYQGNAQFTVSVDGAQVGGTQTVVASHTAGQLQTFDVLGNLVAGPHTVTVNFLNDKYDGTSIADRNLYVTGASVDGAPAPAGTLTLMSGGAQSFRTAVPDTLTLGVSEDAYQGDAQFTVSVDGQQVGGTRTVTALHSAGQSQAVTLTGSWGLGHHVVAVNFLNDAYAGTAATDRNLFVGSAGYDGSSVGESISQYSAGSTPFTVTSATTYSPGAAGGTITTLGNDIVNAGSGTLAIIANGASVSVIGGSGQMSFVGSAGNDTIRGGTGATTLAGGADHLLFTAGGGSASIKAGSGHEAYTLVNGQAGGSLSITGFTSGLDTIHLQGYAGTGLASQQVVGSSLQLTLTDHTSLTLIGGAGLSTTQIFS